MAISSFSRSGLSRVVANGPAVISGTATGAFSDSGKNYAYYTFTANGTLTISEEGLAEVLVVGSGAGGDSSAGVRICGGGGGAVRWGTFLLPAGSHTVTIGAGGSTSGDGNPSSLGSILKCGGGQKVTASASTTFFLSSGKGGGGSPGGISRGSGSGSASGGGAGGLVYGSNEYDGITINYDNTSTERGIGGYTGGAGSPNTGNGGYSSNAGGSGIVVVRVEV